MKTKFSEWLKESYPGLDAGKRTPDVGFMGYGSKSPYMQGKTPKQRMSSHYSDIRFELANMPPELKAKVKKLYNQIQVAQQGSDFTVNYMTPEEFSAIMPSIVNDFNEKSYYISYDPKTMTISVGDKGDI